MTARTRFAPCLDSLWLVLLFLVASRLLLTIPALVAADYMHLDDRGGTNAIQAIPGLAPHTLPGVWARWDSGYYLKIARSGYSPHGEEVNFFPAYPLAMRMLALGNVSWLPWSGFLLSNAAVIAALLLLWLLVKEHYSAQIAWGTIITFSVFPTALFFSALYAESLFLLASILVVWFSWRKQYLLAALFVALASVTRIYGFLLVLIPLIELYTAKPPQVWRALILTSLISLVGLVPYGLYLAVTQGSPFAFVTTQQQLMGRSFSFPGISLLDSVRVALSGYGGFQTDWFMRATSVQDALAMLLAIICSVLGFYLLKEKSLAIYLAICTLLLTTSHGPATLGAYSMSRYVLALFPVFIILGILLTRLPRLKWAIWGVSTVLLCLLTGWFASGRWVA